MPPKKQSTVVMHDRRVDPRVFDVVSCADAARTMTVTSHDTYRKISKGEIDVLLLPKRQPVIIDRRSEPNSVFTDLDRAMTFFERG